MASDSEDLSWQALGIIDSPLLKGTEAGDTTGAAACCTCGRKGALGDGRGSNPDGKLATLVAHPLVTPGSLPIWEPHGVCATSSVFFVPTSVFV